MIIRDIYDGLCEYLWLNNPMSHYFPFLAHSGMVRSLMHLLPAKECVLSTSLDLDLDGELAKEKRDKIPKRI